MPLGIVRNAEVVGPELVEGKKVEGGACKTAQPKRRFTVQRRREDVDAYRFGRPGSVAAAKDLKLYRCFNRIARTACVSPLAASVHVEFVR